MKVFLSWSGALSHRVALVLRDWLPSVIQSVVPYVSSEDIDKGARWSTDIAKELEDSAFGILCVTKENIRAPWLTFEAGALSKKLDKAYVSPFLFNIKRSEIDGPILQFQSTVFEKEDIVKLLKTINKACGDEQLKEERLIKTFEVWYPKLEEELGKIDIDIDTETVKTNEKGNQEILEEILELTRINQKILRSPEIIFPSEYLKQVFIDEDSENAKYTRERQMIMREIEGQLFRISETLERCKKEGRIIDEEIEINIHRIVDFFSHLTFLDKRIKKRRIGIITT